MALLEHRSIPEILDFFEDRGLPLGVGITPPARPTEAETKAQSSELRRQLRSDPLPPYWVSLGSVRFYGSGDSQESAIRSAARRWRIEQASPDPC